MEEALIHDAGGEFTTVATTTGCCVPWGMLPPILFVIELPGGNVLPVFTYGVMRAFAIIAAFIMLRFAFRRRGVDPDHAFMATLWVAPVAIIAAIAFDLGRALSGTDGHGLTATEALRSTVLESGGTAVLALPAAALTLLAYARSYGLAAGPCLDSLALAVCVAIPIQRVGCFAAGCCFGSTTDLPWAVTYGALVTGGSRLAPGGIPIHPTQLYEAIAVSCLLVLLMVAFARRPHAGTVGWLFLGGYSAIRFVNDFFRGDPRPFLIGHGFWAAHLVFAAGIIAALMALTRDARSRRADV